MNRIQLLERVSKQTGVPFKQCEAHLKATLDEIKGVLSKRGKVDVRGLGVFKTVKRAKRTVTMKVDGGLGTTLQVPAHHAPKFRASKALKDAINKR